MNSRTNKKISVLQEYCEKNYERFKEQYPEVIGIHIGKKERVGKELNYYSIVFHVTKKGKTVDNPIPAHIRVKFPEIGYKNIPTDVVEREDFELLSAPHGPGDLVVNSRTNDFGSCGLLLRKGSQVLFVSNMHVMGNQFITDSHSYVPRLQSGQRIIINLGRNNKVSGKLHKGAFTPNLDVACAIVHPTEYSKVSNYVEGIGSIRNYFNATSNHNNGRPVKIIGQVSGVRSARIGNVRTSLEFTFRNRNGSFRHVFHGISRLDRDVTSKGDSGGLVIDNHRRMIGIILGSDGRYTYFLPIIRIQQFIGSATIY